MRLNEPFPLQAVPSRVRIAILNEFKGRCPSLQEVTKIPDSYWLSTPAIGPAHLAIIRSITDAQPQQTARPSSVRLSDAELLDRLEWLQEELRWLHDQLRARLSNSTRRKPNRQWHKKALQDTAHHAESVP
jgi:hypothetical protein